MSSVVISSISMTDYTLAKVRDRSTPVVCLVIDGFGLGANDDTNAVHAANIPVVRALDASAKAGDMYTTLKAHGTAVGLPTDGDMGNSEVGHNALGAGQVFAQGSKLVAESLATGALFETDSFRGKVAPVVAANGTVHLFGLLSDGGVHSHIDHVFALLKGLVAAGVKSIRLHPLLDGRDVAPDSGLQYLEALEANLAELREQGIDARVASVAGRMYSVMDRYGSDWPMVRRGWRQIVYGHVEAEDITADYPGYFHTAREAVECARAVYPTKLDQFNPVAVIVDEAGKPIGPVADGDLVINWNYRGDRAIQISNAFDQDDAAFEGPFERTHPVTGAPRPKCAYAGMLEYDTEAHIPASSLVPPPAISNVLTSYTCAAGISAYAISETHKFGHVTYFWNGNTAGRFDEHLEEYVEIKSEPANMIEGHPEMRMVEVTDALVAAIESGKHQFLRCNLAGPDMVGHTGNFDSVVRCCECVDVCVKRILAAVEATKGAILITADHGNAEIMRTKAGKAMTSHTCSAVPCWMAEFDPAWKNTYKVVAKQGQGLANVAATMLALLGYDKPEFYHEAIVEFN